MEQREVVVREKLRWLLDDYMMTDEQFEEAVGKFLYDRDVKNVASINDLGYWLYGRYANSFIRKHNLELTTYAASEHAKDYIEEINLAELHVPEVLEKKYISDKHIMSVLSLEDAYVKCEELEVYRNIMFSSNTSSEYFSKKNWKKIMDIVKLYLYFGYLWYSLTQLSGEQITKYLNLSTNLYAGFLQKNSMNTEEAKRDMLNSILSVSNLSFRDLRIMEDGSVRIIKNFGLWCLILRSKKDFYNRITIDTATKCVQYKKKQEEE